MDGDLVFFRADGDDRGVLDQLDPGGFGGEGQRRAQITRIEASFVEANKGKIFSDKTGHEPSEFRGSKSGLGRSFAEGKCLQRRLGSERNFSTRELFYLCEPRGVFARASLAEFSKLGRIFGIVRGQHAGGRPGGLRHGSGPLEDRDAQAMRGEVECEREPDDAGSGNDYIR